MENLRIIWRMREQCVPGALPPFRERRGRGYCLWLFTFLVMLFNSIAGMRTQFKIILVHCCERFAEHPQVV